MFDHGLDAKLSGSGGVTLLHVAALANRPLMCQMLLRVSPCCPLLSSLVERG
jgi:hypothetical protein